MPQAPEIKRLVLHFVYILNIDQAKMAFLIPNQAEY